QSCDIEIAVAVGSERCQIIRLETRQVSGVKIPLLLLLTVEVPAIDDVPWLVAIGSSPTEASPVDITIHWIRCGNFRRQLCVRRVCGSSPRPHQYVGPLGELVDGRRPNSASF